MRDGWKTKTLGSVCDILDSQRKPITKTDRQPGFVPYYGATGIQDYVEDYIFDGRYLLVGEDGAKWGKDEESAYIIEGKAWVNNHAHVLRMHDDVKDTYVKYYLNGKDLNSFITGAVVRKLTQAALVKIPIPIPSLSEQERIVSELDLLSGIIDKQKQQLKELDNLAQSVFYDMFGDPVRNERGWENVTFRETFRLKSGDGLVEKQFIKGPYPVYGGNGISGYHNAYNKDGDFIVIGRVGVYCGNVRYIKGKFWLTDNAFETFFDSTSLNYWYVCFLLNTINLHQYANQAAQPVISNVGLKDISIIIPPIDLQESFAEKIQSIEQQKESIQKSIGETQKLFDYTMDKYFG